MKQRLKECSEGPACRGLQGYRNQSKHRLYADT